MKQSSRWAGPRTREDEEPTVLYSSAFRVAADCGESSNRDCAPRFRWQSRQCGAAPSYTCGSSEKRDADAHPARSRVKRLG